MALGSMLGVGGGLIGLRLRRCEATRWPRWKISIVVSVDRISTNCPVST